MEFYFDVNLMKSSNQVQWSIYLEQTIVFLAAKCYYVLKITLFYEQLTGPYGFGKSGCFSHGKTI